MFVDLTDDQLDTIEKYGTLDPKGAAEGVYLLNEHPFLKGNKLAETIVYCAIDPYSTARHLIRVVDRAAKRRK